MPSLIAETTVDIRASATKVWQVLTVPSYIAQWDDVPEAFGSEALHLGSEFVWENEGGITQMTVVVLEPHTYLRQAWRASHAPTETDAIAYAYALTEREGRTHLTITVGDWATLPDGKRYYEASMEFTKDASQKIKELAERLEHEGDE